MTIGGTNLFEIFIFEVEMMDVLWSIFNRNFETTGSAIFYQQAWSHFSRQGEK